MKILIIEDEELKYVHLETFIKSKFNDADIVWKKSYKNGLEEIMTRQYDLVLLDMSMHIFERTAKESGGSFESYAGKMILSEIDINEINSKVIVVTGYDVYADGKTLDTLKSELRDEFGDYYLDTVYFIGSDGQWKVDISEIIATHF